MSTVRCSRTFGSLAIVCALFGCGEQEIRAIDVLTPPVTPGAGGESGSARRERGRVQIRDGNLLTDKGTRLRGVTLGLDVPGRVTLDSSLFTSLTDDGLNAFHVYLENSSHAPGSHVAEADALVELTSAAGMYLVIGVGGGLAGGSFDLEKVRAFWRFYAPRYAERTHVIYEIHNIPDLRCDVAYETETLAMQREIYALIREQAPSSHVALFSFVAPPSPAALEANLSALEGAVDWSKASIAFHTQSCEGQHSLPNFLDAARARGVAAFASELLVETSFDDVAELEIERTGWFNFQWLVVTQDLDAFRSEHAAAGISWCPDFGAWPEDSERCRTP